MTDNAAYFTSREFQKFACIWDFLHVTCSPHYPQSNGLAERALRSAKHLLEKCARDGTDVYAALLNLCNIPRDGLPSPAQRLLSRRTKTLIPMTKAMYVPKVETQVQAALTQTKQRGKIHYDRSARPLASLQAGQTVRIQTDRGYDILATVIGRALQPNSYQVQAGDATYVRNRHHLVHIPEPTTTDVPIPTVNLCQNPRLMAISCKQKKVQEPPVVVTCSGRISRPNSLYKDYTK